MIKSCAWEFLHPSIGTVFVQQLREQNASDTLEKLMPRIYSAWLDATDAQSSIYPKLIALKMQQPQLFNDQFKHRVEIIRKDIFWSKEISNILREMRLLASDPLLSSKKQAIQDKITEYKPLTTKVKDPTLLAVSAKVLQFFALRSFYRDMVAARESKRLAQQHLEVIQKLKDNYQKELSSLMTAPIKQEEPLPALPPIEKPSSVAAVIEVKAAAVEVKKVEERKALTPKEELDQLLLELNINPKATLPDPVHEKLRARRVIPTYLPTAKKVKTSIFSMFFGWIAEFFKPRSSSQVLMPKDLKDLRGKGKSCVKC